MTATSTNTETRTQYLEIESQSGLRTSTKLFLRQLEIASQDESVDYFESGWLRAQLSTLHSQIILEQSGNPQIIELVLSAISTRFRTEMKNSCVDISGVLDAVEALGGNDPIKDASLLRECATIAGTRGYTPADIKKLDGWGAVAVSMTILAEDLYGWMTETTVL